jgi:glycosyltransferase involved in cell wall biosynthesis
MKNIQKSKPKILFIGPYPPPYGGMAVNAQNLEQSVLKDRYGIYNLDITGLRTRKNANILQSILYQLELVFKLIVILVVKNPHIVHIRMASFFYFYRRSVSIILCKLFGKKIIIHLESGKFKTFFKNSSVFAKCYIKWILQLSDSVIALSQSWKDFLAGLVQHSKIQVIPNGVPIADFQLFKNKKNEFRFNDEHLLVLFAGSIGERKGVFDILQAIPVVLKECSNITFVFCGPENSASELELFRNTIRDKKIEQYVKYIGVISGQEKVDWFISSDVFILPSYAENLPLAMLEAMAAGLPVIVSDVGAIPEVVVNEENGYILKPGDIKGIAQAILKLARDKDLRSEMGRRNLALVKSKYDIGIVANSIDNLYLKLLKS